MLGSSPRQYGLEIAATSDYLSVSKDANSLASFSTTGGSRGSSAVASYSELPEQQQGVTVERAIAATSRDGLSHTIMVQSSSSGALANGSHEQQLDSRSLEGTVDTDNPDVVAQALLPTYAWQVTERKDDCDLKDDERGALEALDDYLASPQVTVCPLTPNDVSHRTTGGCFTASSSPVTREELDRWVQQVHGQLHVIMDTMSAKLSQCRARIAEKDEVIKRLHWRLQNSEWSSTSQSCGPAIGSGGGTNPRTPQRRAVRTSVGGPVIGTGRGVDAPCSPTGVNALRGTRTSTEGATASSSTGATTGRAGSPTSGGPQGRHLRGARENAQREGREQTREKGEQSQITFLRQENAQLRRRNNELSGQVRQRETQMDGLTNMIKEMQVTAQRQSGLFKRQLHIRDDTLLQMQEELLATRGATAIPAPGSVSSTSTTGATKSGDVDVNTNRTTAQLREALGNGTMQGTGGAVSSSSSSRRAGVEIGVTNASLSKSVGSTTQGQAPRAARRPVEGGPNASERGSSAARSLSAFGRNKERQATRRSGDRGEEQSLQTRQQDARQRIEPRIVGSMVQALPTNTGGPPSTSSAGSSVFSPRGRPGKAVGIAQAAHNAVVQSTTHLAHQQSSSAEAPPAGGSRGGPRGSFRGSGNGSIVSGPNSLVWSTGQGSQSSAMHRASSADARTRGSTRGVIVRRANRRQ